MFAYCCNNPVTREDPDGEAFDTVFDILSLGASIADVISNPRDPWAWAGLAGDVIDVAVPFVTGVGEVTRAAKVAKETAEVVDDTCAEVFKKLLPDDYREVSSTITEHMTLVTYENSLGNVAQLYVTPTGGEVNIDTENAIYSEVELSGYIAILLEKDGYQVTWTDSDAGLLYMVHADGFTKDFVLEICQAIATHTD